MDFSTNGIAHNIIDHAPLIVALAITMWWVFPKVLSVALRNGSGELIRAIIREENASQSKATREMVKEEIKIHEEVERNSLRAALTIVRDEIEADGRVELGKFEKRLDRFDVRTAAIEAKLFKRSPRRSDDD